MILLVLVYFYHSMKIPLILQ